MTDAILNFERKPEDDFYSLLGCDELSSTEQIQTEYKIRAKELHPDRNACEEATRKFALIQRAKEVLTDPSRRVQYDQWRRSGIAVSFDDWLARKDLVHMSMHWIGQKAKKCMLEEKPASQEAVSTNAQEESSNLTKDYEDQMKMNNDHYDELSIRHSFKTYKI